MRERDKLKNKIKNFVEHQYEKKNIFILKSNFSTLGKQTTNLIFLN